MGTLRDMRARIEALEERECECECDSGSGWPGAWCWIAFWAFLAVSATATAYSTVHSPVTPPAPHSSVECIKAGGEWSGFGFCKKAQ